ncbi:fused response regulator/phosphatase [Mucilaginibacter terrae]|uniref:Sigma-B regulation protein RsbU (Phosphoserine phosphatase) n=1 Tax=Mucilaginibacter terrae TaxID=1955052 RepID=A0ABU3GX82_9SPHI|nr:fused response regulator/phosphatase [Mucilaginibacter terrae]MDT3404201.1 sigma-B regulation protein RsbU (phosphoserine phosphatase) [Mucilaginibacter terrae]
MESSSKHILLVDDNPLFLKLLIKSFTRKGFSCNSAHDAIQALELLKGMAPDVIISDYEMPVMNGLEFRQQVLADERLRDIPFMFLTGFEGEDVMYKGLDLQAIDYVSKDTPVDVIIAKINNLLHTVSKQRELSELEIKKTVAALNIKAVPDKLPLIEGFNIDFWHRDYQDIPGGDFIDFIDAAQYLYIILGDIMGKKWKAWFYTFTYLSYIRAAVRFGISGSDHSAAGIMQKINEVICDDEGLRDILSSVSLIRIHKPSGKFTYTGAGDLPLLHYRPLTRQVSQITSSGFLLGLMANGSYTEQEIDLAEGDQLFIFTDGLIDFAANESKKSDYALFAKELEQLLNSGQTFAALKNRLQDSEAMVDDSSIIQIHKPTTYV